MVFTRQTFVFGTIFALALAACGGQAATAPPSEAAAVEPADTEPSPTEAPTATTAAEPAPAAWASQFPPLDAVPQDVEIPTADGRILAGRYYPAKVNPAPIVVLMHWAVGDMTDWRAIAPWLQNRLDEAYRAGGLAKLAQIDGPWLDPSWFPAILPEASFGVLVFDYNGFGQSASSSNSDAWLQDSLAAVLFASTLEGADPNMIMAVGGSIGADGAVDGCYLFNELVTAGEAQGECIGALSLSPGNTLTRDFTYTEALTALSEAEHLVFCLAAEGDPFSAETCLDAQSDFSTAFIYRGDAHGMMLVDPTMQPSQPAVDANALDLLLDLLAMATGLPVTP